MVGAEALVVHDAGEKERTIVHDSVEATELLQRLEATRADHWEGKPSGKECAVRDVTGHVVVVEHFVNFFVDRVHSVVCRSQGNQDCLALLDLSTSNQVTWRFGERKDTNNLQQGKNTAHTDEDAPVL